MFCVDLWLVAMATVLALVIRDDFSLSIERLQAVAPYFAATLAAAALAIPSFGLHRAIWRLSAGKDYERVAYAALATVIAALAIGFTVNRLTDVPRALPVLQFGLIAGLMLGARATTRRLRDARTTRIPPQQREQGSAARSTVLVIGVNAVAELYLRGVSELGAREIEIAGLLGRNERQVGRRIQNYRILGLPEDVTDVLKNLEVEGVVVDRIAIAVPMHKLSAEVRKTLREIERATSITLHPLADQIGLGLAEGAHSQAQLNSHNLSNLEFSISELRLVAGRRYFVAKRALDVAGAIVLLTLGSPFIVLVALLVAADVGAPIVFCQRRPGLRGRPFKLYKFRTMGRAFDIDGNRIADEERSSWIGRCLRRTRLDELPQLYNVLIGDMSFVGPRPLLPIDQRPEYKARLLVRPGITGWAQVEGGRIIEPADKAAMDVWYVQQASLALDLRIALLTVPVLLYGDRVNAGAIDRAWRDLMPTGICTSWIRPTGRVAALMPSVGMVTSAGDTRPA
jgi:lipopolysaccharide/colanic/teichoic acid biosynthesis glycosyltransferase